LKLCHLETLGFLGVQFFPCLAVRGGNGNPEEQLPVASGRLPVVFTGNWQLGTGNWSKPDAD